MYKFLIAVLLSMVSLNAFAARSTFQNSCSNIDFAYDGSKATVVAMCLNDAGKPKHSQLEIQGISNQNGRLTHGSGASSFQQSCGNIQIQADGPDVTLYAICRTGNGDNLETSIPLNGINNNNGSLSY